SSDVQCRASASILTNRNGGGCMRGLGYALSVLLVAGGCASTAPSGQSNLTPGMVKKNIIKNQTTQNDILEVFGAPNIVTKNKTGNEVWTYDKVSIDTGASNSFGTLVILDTSGSRTSASNRTFTLMIEFD